MIYISSTGAAFVQNKWPHILMFASWARPTTLKEPFSCWMLECTSCALASSFKWHRWRTASLHQVHLNRFLSITMKFDAMTQHPDKNQLNEGDDKTSCVNPTNEMFVIFIFCLIRFFFLHFLLQLRVIVFILNAINLFLLHSSSLLILLCVAGFGWGSNWLCAMR